jgi:hypothetical protein
MARTGETINSGEAVLALEALLTIDVILLAGFSGLFKANMEMT